MFHGDVAKTSGPREIAVFENFEMHPFIDDHDDQWSVEANRFTPELSHRMRVAVTLLRSGGGAEELNTRGENK